MSGKVAKKLRKQKKISKKTAALCLAVCMGASPAAADGEFIVSLYPHISKPFGITHEIQNGIGAGAKLTYRPLDFLNVFAYGDYLSLSLPNVQAINLFDGGLGLGYHQGISDHMAFDVNFEVGAYQARSTKKLSGLTGGVSLTFTYKINPIMATDVNASASHYASGSTPLMTVNAAASPGLSINLSELFNNKTKLNFQNQELAPVFPVLYGWYENNSFGKVSVTNEEDSSITDVTVSFYQPQYMGHPKECATFKNIKKGESVDVDLYAFFNEQMLELTEKTDTHAEVIVSYSCLGQKRSKSFSFTVPVYGRNNMSWDDDRRAAVFVSSKDPAAMLFAKYITSVVRDNVRNGVPANVQYAMGIFEALDQFGLSYVIDPSSAFEDNVGTSSIDFLQFPYQTLMYRGGDCDDISILVCSLFEAVGINTAFITIPGHIFMAFDSGLNVQQAKAAFSSLDELIVDGKEVWVPLEITLSDEGFNKAWRVGAREWNTSFRAGTAAMYKMKDSWEIYQPVSVPGATAQFTMPDRKIVAKLFDHRVDEWITREIEPQIRMYEAKLTVKDDEQTRNSLGVLYGKYGLFLQADEQFKKARRQGYVPSIINTGNVYFSMQDYKRASKWYKSVLKEEPDNVLALVGVARCAYEVSDYKECDAAYERVKELSPEIALEYEYLGTFVSKKGRAFSLADRLQNTIWSEEEEKVPEAVKQLVEPETTVTEVIQEEPLSDTDLEDLFDFGLEALAAVPVAETEEEEDLEDYDLASAAGDGDPDKEDVLNEDPEGFEAEEELAANTVEAAETEESISEEAPVVAEDTVDISVFTESFSGLASEVALLDTSDFVYEDFDEEELPPALAAILPPAEKENKPAEKAAPVAAPASSVTQFIAEVTGTTVEAVTASVVTVAPVVTAPVVSAPVVAAAAEKTVEKAAVATAAVVAAETVPAVTASAEVVTAPAPVIEAAPVEAEPVVETTPVTQTFVAEVEAPVAEEPVPVVAEAAKVETEPAPVVVEAVPVVTETAPVVTEVAVAATESVPVVTETAPVVTEPTVVTETSPVVTEPEDTSLAFEDDFEDEDEIPFNFSKPKTTVAAVETAPVVTEAAEAAEFTITLAPSAITAPAAPAEVEIIPMEIPRFTTQPSEEWAPEAAYTAETIPGMKSFEEEMGNYQNSKSFLYEETAILDTDPEADVDKDEISANDEKFASAGIPDVNPFSSYLSEEDAKVVETITNYKIEEVAKEPEAVKAPEVKKTVAAAPAKAEEKTPVKMPSENTEKPAEKVEAVVPAEKSEEKAEEKSEIKSEVKAEEKSEVKQESKVEVASEEKTEVKQEPKTEAAAQEKAVVVTEEKKAAPESEKSVEVQVTADKVADTVAVSVPESEKSAEPVIAVETEKSEQTAETSVKTETVKTDSNKTVVEENKEAPKASGKGGLLALASAIIAAGAAGGAFAIKKRNKKKGEE